MAEDRLLELGTKIEAATKLRNLTLFKADDLSWLWSHDESGRRETATDVVEWREGEGWEEFVGTEAAMGANVLYLDARKFSWNDLIERIDGLSALNPEEIAKRKRQAGSVRLTQRWSGPQARMRSPGPLTACVGRQQRGYIPIGGKHMERYRNLGGDSGVVGYEIGPDFIRVQFSDGAIYLYTYTSAGAGNIEHMKQLARNGQGLNSFINTTVPKAYAQKER